MLDINRNASFYKKGMTNSIRYEDIAANWHNPNWEEWDHVRWIEGTIDKPICQRYQIWYNHVANFVNNYLWEDAITKNFKNLKFGDDTHDSLHVGKGQNTPDLWDLETGKRIEVKRCYSIESSEDIMAKKKTHMFRAEHKANAILFYNCNNGEIYYGNLDTRKSNKIATIAIPDNLVEYDCDPTSESI